MLCCGCHREMGCSTKATTIAIARTIQNTQKSLIEHSLPCPRKGDTHYRAGTLHSRATAIYIYVYISLSIYIYLYIYIHIYIYNIGKARDHFLLVELRGRLAPPALLCYASILPFKL